MSENETLPEHPEVRGDQPLIGEAVQDILVDLFAWELDNGTPDWDHGTGPEYQPAADQSREALHELARIGEITFADMLIAQACEAASRTDPIQLRQSLVSLGATVVQWIEQVDEDFGSLIENDDE